jgi:hypothetical protein
MSRVRPSLPESVVRLTIVGGALTNDVAAVLRSPGGCGEDCGGSEGEGEEGIGTPAGVCARVCACEGASDIACASVIVRVVVDPLVVSSDCTDCETQRENRRRWRCLFIQLLLLP